MVVNYPPTNSLTQLLPGSKPLVSAVQQYQQSAANAYAAANNAANMAAAQQALQTKPPQIVLRDRFATLIHAVEDINGPKYPYDDAVFEMLDMRPLKTKSEIKLVPFLYFLIANGVDTKNIPALLKVVEGWGMTVS